MRQVLAAFPLLAREKNVSFSSANCFDESWRGSQAVSTGGGGVWEKVGGCHFGVDEVWHLQKLSQNRTAFPG